jgi:hypothetical protein
MDREDAVRCRTFHPWPPRFRSGLPAAATPIVRHAGDTGPVQSPVKALVITVAYAVTVGVVVGALVLTADADATPWIALLAAMAVVHLGFGLIVARFAAALLPLVVSVVAMLAHVGDFSITTLLVGLPCALLVVSGVSLRIGWDGGPKASPADQIRRERRRVAADASSQTGEWDPIQPQVWDDAIA